MIISDPRPFPEASPYASRNAPPIAATTGIPGPASDPRSPLQAAYTIEISPRARELSASSSQNRAAGLSPPPSLTPESSGTRAASALECQTCKNRKYQDVSSDATVSFQTPTRIAPGSAESMVRAHEQEHVRHEQVKAQENGSSVVSQNVTIHYQICPECGRPFVAGGTTTTVTRTDAGTTGPENVTAGRSGRQGLDVRA